MSNPGVIIAGAAETDQIGRLPDHSTLGLHVEAARNAVADAGLTMADIDGIATVSAPGPVQVAHALGIYPDWLDGTGVGGTSFLLHVRHAAAAIRAGYARTILITHGESGRSRVGAPPYRADPSSPAGQFEAPYGTLGPTTTFTIPALRYMKEYGLTREQLAYVAVAQRRWASRNPRAMFRDIITVDDVLASRIVAYPFHLLECCLVTDGGGALVVTSADRAAGFPQPPVHVLGTGEAAEAPMISQMIDFTESQAFRQAGQRAFAEAGITTADVGHLMIYDAFAHVPIYGLEALGFVKKGEGGPFIADGNTEPGGSLPLNTNGGGLSYTHTGMYGMFAIQEGVRQIRGQAAAQLAAADISVVVGNGGMFATCGVLVLGKQPRLVSRHWIGTWAAAPQWTEPADLPPAPFTQGNLAFADSTLRQSARVSVGGRQLRLRLSNAYGGTSLDVTAVSLALPRGGQAGIGAIEAGTSAAVTFGGRRSARVPAGAHLTSDPLAFPLAAGASVTATIYLAAGQAPGDITSHAGSRTTSYLLAGNHVDDEDLAGAAPVDHWYFLSGIDVRPDAVAAAAAVMLGDSLTDGRGSTTNGNDRWPDRLCARLRSGRDTAGTAIVNQAIGGNRVLRDGLGPSALARLDRDVLGVSGVEWLVVFAGVNDIGTAHAMSTAQARVAADLIAAYERIVTQAHARGIRVYGATLTPFGGNPAYDDPRGHREAARQAVNEWIRGGQRFDAVIDFDRAVRDPSRPRFIRSSLDCGDRLHLSPAGYQALADAVPASLFAPVTGDRGRTTF